MSVAVAPCPPRDRESSRLDRNPIAERLKRWRAGRSGKRMNYLSTQYEFSSGPLYCVGCGVGTFCSIGIEWTDDTITFKFLCFGIFVSW